MELVSIFYSPTDTSKKIAETIISGIKQNTCMFATEKTASINITHMENPDIATLNDCFAIVSAPVYGGRLAETARRRLETLKGRNSSAFAVVLYGNRDYEDALAELADLLHLNGFNIIGAAAFIGEHSYSRKGMPIAAGRPDEIDIAKAWNLGKDIAETLSEIPAGHPDAIKYPLDRIKGNRPYKELKKRTPQAPVTDMDACIGCGRCDSACPVKAITLTGGKAHADAAVCTGCCACVKICPAGALSYDTPFTEYLFRNFSSRKEPEIFMQTRI